MAPTCHTRNGPLPVHAAVEDAHEYGREERRGGEPEGEGYYLRDKGSNQVATLMLVHTPSFDLESERFAE